MQLQTPLKEEILNRLNIGDKVSLNGMIYTARDAAHQRLITEINQAREENRPPNLPFDPTGQVIYYVGPSPAQPGQAIGSAGPTTSYRMDTYTPLLLEYGLKAMIGKGKRSAKVIEAIKKYKAIYFAAVGGAAVLLAEHIKKADIIAYEDLGPEAVRRLEVVNFPLIVVNDTHGNDLYEAGVKSYARS